MAFVQLMSTSLKLDRLRRELAEEKVDAVKIAKTEKPRWKLRHLAVDMRVFFRRFFRRALSCFFFEKCCYNLRHHGSCENFTLRSVVGFLSGYLLTYVFFMFCVFQLNFKLTTATVMCSILGCILTIGLAFSTKVRCIVLLTLPQFFSQRGRQALLAYAFILAISGPAKKYPEQSGDSERVASLRPVRVIKAAFEFLAKIISICNKELGTPFERCSRVFENAIADCNAKLGPLFNWLCSITYIVKSVCYLVKFLDFICILVDFISNSVIGVVIRKVKTFIRHIKTMFYVRIKFSHSFQFQTNSSRTVSEIAHEIVGEIRERTRVLAALFTFMTSAATLFFVFMIMDSKRLAKTEKKALSKAVTTLASASLKLAIFLAVDYCLFWILNLIKYYGRFQSKVQAPNVPRAYISGNGLLADLLRGIVRAFQPMGIQLEIDTVPCLPTPIPPNYDRYVQIATLLVLCWVLTLLEPYGLRLRNMIMCYYHPTRAKERAIWLYNHIMRSRNSFKIRQEAAQEEIHGRKGIEKVCRFCLGEGLQTACLLCGQVFRESDNKKPIRCQTPGCPGTYCEQCFSDLQNLCTLCLSPIEYGDMSDISEEK
ncbi:hypothetical protein NQ318_008554 [Aromia moschata]|uniref:Dendritic cell-specific transmembrane protein-like domain-containing protein n=1 Tax=Aromia moschata TaxID=1265417 RepID=A0AAV8YXS1_9CUCU|nr:hypothetical protein NQ318_008554 [Aromia moschata]